MHRLYWLKHIIFLLLLVILDAVIGQMLRSANSQYFMEKTMHEFYQQKENIDLLFMGSSHSYYHFNPCFFEEHLGITSFNLGSAGQNPTSTYYLLKEVFNRGHQPKVVVLETSWRPLTGKDTDFYSASRVFHALRWSVNKLALFWNSFSFPSSLRLFSRTFHYRRNIRKFFEPSEDTQKEKYRLNLSYIRKGFVTSAKKATPEELAYHEFKNKTAEFNSYRLLYLKKTIRFALKNHACVVGVISPLPPSVFSDIFDYTRIHDRISAIYESFGITLIDLNLINQERAIVFDDDFMDSNHLNSQGANKINMFLTEYFRDHLPSLTQ
ncbi:hypothetical protein GF337_04215 [candidate division KSB1 bacterium]|nr:hypothetical protein [candidate division KSB1 bacterium]